MQAESIRETPDSRIAYGWRDGQPVVLKVLRRPGDEWFSGEVLAAFGGRGVVPIYEHSEGALLLDWLRPGGTLVHLALAGRDEEATAILADVIRRMPVCPRTVHCPAVEDWSAGFERYRDSGDHGIPGCLVEEAGDRFRALCASQREPRLLHGDLHHYNVLLDARNGWAAIDPKGVFGELEYEIGAALRNPVEHPACFVPRAVLERRLKQFAQSLNLDSGRTLGWAFAQAVLSAIWEFEDTGTVEPGNPMIPLAESIRPMLP